MMWVRRGLLSLGSRPAGRLLRHRSTAVSQPGPWRQSRAAHLMMGTSISSVGPAKTGYTAAFLAGGVATSACPCASRPEELVIGEWGCLQWRGETVAHRTLDCKSPEWDPRRAPPWLGACGDDEMKGRGLTAMSPETVTPLALWCMIARRSSPLAWIGLTVCSRSIPDVGV